MRLQKCKNYPKMVSFLLSAENPEHALSNGIRCKFKPTIEIERLFASNSGNQMAQLIINRQTNQFFTRL